MAENEYKCIAFLRCEACGHEFNALLSLHHPPDALGALDGGPARLGEPLYSFYSMECARCGKAVKATIDEMKPIPGTTISGTLPDGTEVKDVPIFPHVKPFPKETVCY